MTALPDLMRRIDRKLDIRRGLSLSYDDLALLVASGAFDVLRQYVEDEERANDLPPIPEGHEPPHPFVYFIQAGDAGPVKIGFARDVEKRRTSLQPSTHEQLYIRACVRCPQYFEGQLHHHFAPERIRGEWFRPSPRLLNYMAALQ